MTRDPSAPDGGDAPPGADGGDDTSAPRRDDSVGSGDESDSDRPGDENGPDRETADDSDWDPGIEVPHAGSAPETPDSVLFTYLLPFVGVLLLAVGIGAAVPGTFAVIQDDATCGNPTITVESPERTAERLGGDPPLDLRELDVTALAPAERAAVEAALSDPREVAQVKGEFPAFPAFRDGVVVRVDGQRHYAAVVAENPCYQVPPLQLPLGVFAVALGTLAVLAPPAYRRLVALERAVD